MACACIHLEIFDFPHNTNGGSQTVSFNGNLTQTGTHNGVPYYEFIAFGSGGQPHTLFLYRDDGGRWGIQQNIAPVNNMMWSKYYDGNCPPYLQYEIGDPNWNWNGTNVPLLSPNLVCTTSPCPYVPCCLQVVLEGDIYSVTYDPNIPGYTWTSNGTSFAIIWNYTGNDCWVVWDLNADELVLELHPSIGENDCPEAIYVYGGLEYEIVPISCSQNCPNEDRTAFLFQGLNLPPQFENYNIGIKDCCCRELVLGSSNQGYENDVTAFWFKLGEDSSATVLLKTDDNVVTTYQPPLIDIVKEPLSIAGQIDWGQVINLDGVGCYKLVINYNLGGVAGSLIYGEYELKNFTPLNAIYTARVKVFFNSYHEKDDIDFTDTNLMGTLRFHGLIGKKQPNTQIDNIIYENREMRSVIRQNLNTYQIETDPLEYCVLEQLMQKFLLHENSMFISDYNFHNYSKFIQDVPVILEESAEVTYYDQSKKASVVAVVGDKVKNDNNYYK